MAMTPEPAVTKDPVVATFIEFADTLAEGFDLVEFVTTLTERIVQLDFASECGILLADASGELEYIAASHERTNLLELFKIQRHEGPCLDCFTTGGPLRVTDLQDERDRWPRFTPLALATGFRSVQVVPLRLRGRVLGAMNLFRTDPGGITEGQQVVVQALADVATIGLLHQRELHGANAVTEQLQHAMRSRIGIEQAKGILAEQGQVPVDTAFDLMRAHARRHRLKLSLLAATVIDGSTDFATITNPTD